MKLLLDGRRLEAKDSHALLAAVGEQEVMALMKSLGFALKPVRVPKRLRHGDLVLRHVWERRDGNVKVTMRHTVTIEAPALA